MPRLTTEYFNNVMPAPERRNPFEMVNPDDRSITISGRHVGSGKVKVWLRSSLGGTTYEFEMHESEFIAYVRTSSTDWTEFVDSGFEHVVRYNPINGTWEFTPERVGTTSRSSTPEVVPRAEMLELRRTNRRLRDQLGELRAELAGAELQRDHARREKEHAESILADLDTLRRTAVVWREARNGTRAKLVAFTDFCAALDSLPAPQDA
ncbi:hypothetical protein SEA_KHARCHO_71 [Arthrobacter phage Kharcho]|nr:hypothetical protein SEA_KHARCHO_71 [Arthrobacter phage Kharcho]